MAQQTTAIDPGAQILGPVGYGWGDFISLSNAPDHAAYDTAAKRFADRDLRAGYHKQQDRPDKAFSCTTDRVRPGTENSEPIPAAER